jgi:uncharacterized Zn-binding protein involved in type VI secretion
MADGSIDDGGYVLASGRNVFVNGKPVLREGDTVLSFIYGITKIMGGQSNKVFVGKRRVATVGDSTETGVKIVRGSPDTFATGK